MAEEPLHPNADNGGAEQDDSLKLTHPWLVAVWPGMGNVALTAGYYLMAKLQMHQLAEFRARDLFELEQIEVQDGLVKPAQLPRSRFFVYRDPRGQHDIVVFIGEAQPPIGKHMFCNRLLDFAVQLGVERLFTFAAMATQMRPTDRARVFGVATDLEGVEELNRLEVEVLESGQITGLNGVLLAVGAERGLRGTGLLGEMPGFAPQVNSPKASLAVLEAFLTLADLELDLASLQEHAKVMEKKLDQALRRLESALRRQQAESGAGEQPFDLGLPEHEQVEQEKAPEQTLSSEDREHIEKLFDAAERNRSEAYELKKELDRLGAFKEYEDRFLDLFKSND